MSSVTLTSLAVCSPEPTCVDRPSAVQSASADKFEALKPGLRERMKQSVARHHEAVEAMTRASNQAKAQRQAGISALIGGLKSLEESGLTDAIVAVWTEASVARNEPVGHQTLFVGGATSSVNLYVSGKFFVHNELGDFRITDPAAQACAGTVFGPFLDRYKTADAALEHIVQDLEWGMDWETDQLDAWLHPKNPHPVRMRPGTMAVAPVVCSTLESDSYFAYESPAPASKY